MVVKFYLQRRWWLLLVSSMLLFELTALYFQYRLELDPCVLCVFQRTAVMGVLVAGLV
ncbi:MAG: disulfide bond formation protein B, partial [Gammaproteobacteria bacterium]|nr:disulfide bond formation protein B [Gammaproteobacteria bacterium]